MYPFIQTLQNKRAFIHTYKYVCIRGFSGEGSPENSREHAYFPSWEKPMVTIVNIYRCICMHNKIKKIYKYIK